MDLFLFPCRLLSSLARYAGRIGKRMVNWGRDGSARPRQHVRRDEATSRLGERLSPPSCWTKVIRYERGWMPCSAGMAWRRPRRAHWRLAQRKLRPEAASQADATPLPLTSPVAAVLEGKVRLGKEVQEVCGAT